MSLLGLTFLALLVGRAVNVYLVSLVGWLVVGRDRWKLNAYEYLIIFLMGLIHGAVPFALSVTIPFLTTTPPIASVSCIQLNIIFVVVISCLLFNLFVPKLIRLMLARIRQLEVSDRNHPSVKDSFL
jgi:NhaP-type Na+/H+ or K+/H+ antiporter